MALSCTRKNQPTGEDKMEFKTQYKRPIHPGLKCDKNTRTEQHHKDSCDINNILKRFERTGILPGQKGPGKYIDVSDLPTYQESLNIVINANDQFASLDSKIRDRFSNDPTKFLEFLQNPENIDEAIKLGLAVKPTVETPKIEPEPKSGELATT